MKACHRASLSDLPHEVTTMNQLDISGIAIAIALAFSASGVAAQTMLKDEYKAAQNRIATEYNSSKAGCGALSANAKDVCIAEAKGKDKVAKAELEARYKPSE